jgi:hypothetical protein
MSFRHASYNSTFLTQAQTTRALAQPDPKYDVRLQPTAAPAGATCWRIIGVHHLTPEENRSRHHAFVEVLDEQGQRVRNPNLKIGWTWEGRNEPDLTAPLEKNNDEPAGDVPIEKGVRLALWLTGDGLPSDRVFNLHCDHPDERAGNEILNSIGHHSYYIVFQRTTQAPVAANGVGQPAVPVAPASPSAAPSPNGQSQPAATPAPTGTLPAFFPEYIFGLHECCGGGEQLMLDAGRPGWVLELASVGLDGGGEQVNANFSHLRSRGLGVIVRLHNGYEPAGALPRPDQYDAFAQSCAKFVARSQGCHVWVIGNEPNHKAERPDGQFITPRHYGDAYRRCRRAIRQLPGHESDLVLVAGPAPWNVETKYEGNPSGDWVQYFADTIAAIPAGECDGFALHTYTFEHDPAKIQADIYHDNEHFRHRRYEFRTYQDFMAAIPQAYRHLPVLITETDPTNPATGWANGHNNGWVCTAYREIADWNRQPGNQPIQALILYRFPDPVHHNQHQWSIANRPGVLADFNAALRAEPSAEFRVRAPQATVDGRVTQPAPLPPVARTIGRIPNIFTNQQLINAFFLSAGALGVVGDQLLAKAGLNIFQLASSGEMRATRYAGPVVNDLPNLNEGERALLETNLVQELCHARRWRGQVQASVGLNLRAQPSVEAPRLTNLPDGTTLDVLDDSQPWLFVASNRETAGFVARDYVRNQDLPREQPVFTPATPGAPVPVAAGFFAADAALRALPLAPAVSEQINLSPQAGAGAQRLARIWNQYGGLLNAVANQLQIDPAVAVAVLSVESGGQAFAQANQPIIRFENHLFYRDWGRNNEEQFARHFIFDRRLNHGWEGHQWRDDPQQPFQPIHTGQSLEWRVLNFAAALNDTVAKRSISMGLPQILGSNHEQIGYGTVQAMFDAFCADERNHVLGLFDFIRNGKTMLTALRNRDFLTFAKEYNGLGQAPKYQGLIANSVISFHQLQEVSMSVDGSQLDPRLDEEIAFIPVPQLPDVFVTASTPQALPLPATPQASPAQAPTPQTLPAPTVSDEAVREAWVKYVTVGLDNINVLFSRVLRAFIIPYYMTVVMYGLLFVVGIGLFITAVVLGLQEGKDVTAMVFAGLSLATFLSFFLSQPLRALEENLQFITWLGITYNTYWTRLLYMDNRATIHADMKDANDHAATEILRIIDKSKELSSRRPRGDVDKG